LIANQAKKNVRDASLVISQEKDKDGFSADDPALW